MTQPKQLTLPGVHPPTRAEIQAYVRDRTRDFEYYQAARLARRKAAQARKKRQVEFLQSATS